MIISFSLELALLFKIVRAGLHGGADLDNLKTELSGQDIDWSRMRKLAIYHRIRPLFFTVCASIGFTNELVAECKLFTQLQAFKNQLYGRELVRIVHLLENNGVTALPYKGLVFQHELYAGQNIRESADLDLLVKAEYAVQALKVLIEDGYIFLQRDERTDLSLEEIIEKKLSNELSLSKTVAGMPIHIDFHWNLHEQFHPFSIDFSSLYDPEQKSSLFSEKLFLPNTYGVFMMLINHHGGRGCWLRLKDIMELHTFNKVFQIPEVELGNYAANAHMKTVFKMGGLLDRLVLSELPSTITVFEKNTLNRIIRFWESSDDLSQWITPRMNYIRIYRRMQDKLLSRWKMIKTYVAFLTNIHPLVDRNEFPFPSRFVFLNAAYKGIVLLKRRIGDKLFFESKNSSK